MNTAQFDQFLEEIFDKTRAVLASKGNEYATDASRFHNFETAAAFNSGTPEQALWGMATKHLVSLSDMVKGDSTSYSSKIWDEKIGDSVNYLVLLWGMVTYHNQVKPKTEKPPRQLTGTGTAGGHITQFKET